MTDKEKDEKEEVEESSTETGDEDSDKKDGIPHDRVKKMVENAKAKGKEEALKELIDEDKTEEPKAAPEVNSSNELEQAEQIIQKAVDRGMKPYMVRQEVEKFLENNPDSLQYIDSIKGLKKDNPNLSWEDAFKLASHEDKLAEAKTESEAKQVDASKPAAQTEKPMAETPKEERPFEEKIMDTEVPLADIEKELNEKLSKR